MQNRVQNLGIVFLLGILAGTAGLRNLVWQSEITLWRDIAAKSPNQAQANYELGMAYARSGNGDKAFVFMQRAAELDPSFIAQAMGESRKTIEEYQEILRKDPNRSLVHNQLGMAYHKKDLLKEAIGEYQISIGLDPTISAVHCNLGIAYFETGLPEEAKKEFDEAIRLDSNDPEPHARLSMIFISAGKYEEALAEIHKGLKIDPEHVVSKKLLTATRELIRRNHNTAPRKQQ